MCEIDIQTRTLYAELIEMLQIVEASRTISSLKGSFSIKMIKGEEYVYYQSYNPGARLEQIFIGARNDLTEQLMRDYAEGKSAFIAIGEKLKRLSSQIQAGVKMTTDKAMTRVVRSLADAGVLILAVLIPWFGAGQYPFPGNTR